MKRTRLFDLLKNRKFELGNKPGSNAEPNPFFSGKTGKMDVSLDLSQDDEEGMDDFVRGMGARRGLNTVARSFKGSNSGVNASRFDDMVRKIGDGDDDYDDMVRDIDDLDFGDDNIPVTQNSAEDMFSGHYDGKDDLYLTRRNRSYDRNEFNDDGDVDDFDAETGWAFMRQLANDTDDENEMDPDDDDFMLNYGGEKIGEDDFDPDDGGDGISDMGNDDEMHGVDGEDEDEDEDEVKGFDDDDEMGSMAEPEPDKYEGIVRSIRGAYLVSKKRQPDETYTEVWIYNVGGQFEDESNIRRGILAGTDIDPTKSFSEDGSQEAVIKTVGNVQFLTLVGLPD